MDKLIFHKYSDYVWYVLKMDDADNKDVLMPFLVVGVIPGEPIERPGYSIESGAYDAEYLALNHVDEIFPENVIRSVQGYTTQIVTFRKDN